MPLNYDYWRRGEIEMAKLEQAIKWCISDRNFIIIMFYQIAQIVVKYKLIEIYTVFYWIMCDMINYVALMFIIF